MALQGLSNQNQALHLEDVIIAFQEWRSGPRPRGRIPESLWDKVITLLNDYPESKVRQSLGISKQQLHKKLDARRQDVDCNQPAPAFVRAIAAGCDAVGPYRRDLLLSRTDGTELQIKQLSQQDVLLITQQFLRRIA